MTKFVQNRKTILPVLKKPDYSDLPKKQQILAITAWDLFNTYGYKRTTVTDICSTAKTSKVTFYKYFRNKLGIVKFIIDSIIMVTQDYFESVMAMKMSSPGKFGYIVSMKEQVAHWISHVFYLDLVNLDDEAGRYFNELQKSRLHIMREFFILEQKMGELDRKMNVDFMVHIIQKISETINDDEIKTIYSGDLPRLSRDVTRFVFFGITSND